jgi:hypothetical protein
VKKTKRPLDARFNFFIPRVNLSFNYILKNEKTKVPLFGSFKEFDLDDS